MAKVIRVFRERLHGFKRYEIGDDYPEDNLERVKYLVLLGYLEEPEPEKPPNKPKRKKGADGDDSDA